MRLALLSLLPAACSGQIAQLRRDLDVSWNTATTGDTATILVPRSVDGRPDRCAARVIGKVVDPA